MRVLFAVSLMVWQFLASNAQAGAWLREKGTGFASLSFGATEFSETTNALYVEYGLSNKTTIGLDISSFTNAQNVRNGFGNLFIRRAIGPTDRPSKWAYELGIGGLWGNERQLPSVKTTLSWGRGFQLRARDGWINMDAAYVYEPTLGSHITKFDATLGLHFGGITTGLLEVTHSSQNDDTFGAVEPSVLIRPKDGKFSIKLGAQIPFDEGDKAALKLGVWHSF
ncbi:hypothetical protein HKX54_08495 [Sulfitobacter sp. M57]|uniref:hypothetical protein n=1 Tax=unclassified Sulfitobacter TaxID=196795 RepID=UPI0023E27704|nr:MULTISPECIES: hypothetical protein [unclassified Sulfitobacter]MDF3414491.1 hypothetical protein [Sulfitobacter sp. KE5]MDF3421972.1 hypothetical protein [Sulfitobacter sp. KE43]MDF3433037.1 hypothetical protein [Sulfitobacter sp. KE42]MDF3458677.1 hypothetical protein [Sulfitobacter sp. S74]MDF3462577.1 hypothetical protein [Sulfitobacter sp. Ks18]